MAFADPQSVTISGYNAGAAVSLPRVASGNNAGGFRNSNGEITMAVSSAYGKRVRQTIRLNQKKTSADVIVPAQNVISSASVYLVVDTPTSGFSSTEAKALVDALVAYLGASSGAKVTQLLGGEN